MPFISPELRIALLVLALCLASSLASARIVGSGFEDQVERAGEKALVAAAQQFASQERAEIEKLRSTLDAILVNDALADAFVARDRERLLALSAPLFAKMRSDGRITHWYFIEAPPAKRVFLRVHRPELHSDVVERATLAAAIASGQVGSGKELGQTAFALRVVRPWVRGGKVIGYVELAEEIDHFLTAMKARTGDEYGVLVRKQFLDEKAWTRILGARANTWNDRPDVVVVDTTIFNLGIADFAGDLGAIPEEGQPLGEIEADGKAWLRGIFPIRDAAGRSVGGLFVLHDFTSIHRAVRAGMVQTVFTMVGVSISVALMIVLALRRTLFRRLRAAVGALESAAEGAGLPTSRVVRLFPGDPLVRLETLGDRLRAAAAAGRGAPGAPRGPGDAGDDPASRVD